MNTENLIEATITLINNALPKGFKYQFLDSNATLRIFFESDDAETPDSMFRREDVISFKVETQIDNSLAFYGGGSNFGTKPDFSQLLPEKIPNLQTQNLADILKRCYNLTPLQRATKFAESNDELLMVQQLSYSEDLVAKKSDRLFVATFLSETELCKIEQDYIETIPAHDFWYTFPESVLRKTKFGKTADEALTRLIDAERFNATIVDSQNNEIDDTYYYELGNEVRLLYGIKANYCSLREKVSREHNLVEVMIVEDNYHIRLIVDGKFLTPEI